MVKIWAGEADPSDIIDPDISESGKTEKGWVGTDIPPHTTFNFEQNRQSAFNSHINIEGIAVWDKDSPYIEDSLTKDPDDRKVYRALEGTEENPLVGFQPSLNLSKWRKQIETELDIIVTPTNVSPTDPEIVDTTPNLVTSAFRTILNVAHSASEYRVARDSAMTDFITLSGTLGAVESWIVTPALAVGDEYWWDARYQNSDGTWSEYSSATSFTLPEAAVQVPTNTAPANGDISVTDTTTLTADAFASTPASVHEASQWLYSTDPSFTVGVIDSGEDAVNLTSLPITGLALGGITYYWKVRYKSDTLGWSSYSSDFNFTTVNQAVQQPTNVTPVNTTNDVSSSVQLTADSFTAIPAASETHTDSQWQVATDAGFTSIFLDSGDDPINLETINISGLADGTTTYYWRVRYKGSLTGYSVWSNPFTFVTKAAFSDWLNYDALSDGVLTVFSGEGFDTINPSSAIDMCEIDDGKFLTVHKNRDGDVEASVVTTSGLTPTYGGVANLGNTDYDKVRIIKLSTDRALYVFNSSSTVSILYRVITVSGTTPTAGTTGTLAGDSSAVGHNWDVARTGDDEAVFMYNRNVSSLNRVTIAPVTVSGDVATKGSNQFLYTLAASASISSCAAANLNNAGQAVLAWTMTAAGDQDLLSAVVTVTAGVLTAGSVAGDGDSAIAESNRRVSVVATSADEYCVTAFSSTGGDECIKYSYSGNVATLDSQATRATGVGRPLAARPLSPANGVWMAALPNTDTDDLYIQLIDVIGTPVFETALVTSVSSSTPNGGIINLIDEENALLVYDDGINTSKMQVLNGAA